MRAMPPQNDPRSAPAAPATVAGRGSTSRAALRELAGKKLEVNQGIEAGLLPLEMERFPCGSLLQ